MAIKYLENPIKCPFCQDLIHLEKEQLDTLESIGDHGFLAVSPTCSSTVEINTANSLVYDQDGLVHHANTRVYWNRVQIERQQVASEKDES